MLGNRQPQLAGERWHGGVCSQDSSGTVPFVVLGWGAVVVKCTQLSGPVRRATC